MDDEERLPLSSIPPTTREGGAATFVGHLEAAARIAATRDIRVTGEQARRIAKALATLGELCRRAMTQIDPEDP